MKNKALLRAIRHFGNQKILAKKCGLSQQTISRWLKFGVPIQKTILIEEATDGIVTRRELCPEFYQSVKKIYLISDSQ